jgi:hypothetical protein
MDGKTVSLNGVVVDVLEDLEVGVLEGNGDTHTYSGDPMPAFPNTYYHRALAIRPDSGDLMVVARARGTERWFLDGAGPEYSGHLDALERLRTAQ